MVATLAHLPARAAFAPAASAAMAQAPEDVCNVLHIFAGDQCGQA